MSLALFITQTVSTAVIEQVLEEGSTVGAYLFFVAEPEDVCPLERWINEGTKTPIPKTWQSNFVDYTPGQCSDFLKALLPESVYENDNNEIRNSRRFAILDELFTQSGELLACNREEDDSVTSFRMKPAIAASYLEAWYPDQWEDHLRLQAEQVAVQKRAEDQRKSRRAALARHLGSV